MAVLESQRPVGQVPPSWVVTLSADGEEKGMVGPFPDADAAERWATEMTGGRRRWSWRCEPVVSPAALPAPEPTRPTRHLRLVQ